MFNKIFSPIFSSLKKPKWQHSNPKIRKQGILEELEPGHTELTKIAQDDPDSSIRICAIKRLTSLDSIQEVIKNSSSLEKSSDDSTLAAHQHFSAMLSGETFPLADIVDRLEVIRGHIPDKICEYVAQHAKEEELRLIILDKVRRDALLGDIALNDSSQEVRLKAITTISKKSTLQRICKQSRNKNKQVYHAAKIKLELLLDDETRPQRNAQETKTICEDLEKLFKRQLIKQEEHTFKHLVKRWDDVKNFASRASTERFEAIVENIHYVLNELEEEENIAQKQVNTLGKILENLSVSVKDFLSLTPDSSNEEIDSKQSEIFKLKKSWAQELKTTPKEISSELVKQYQSIINLLDADDSSCSTSIPDITVPKIEPEAVNQSAKNKLSPKQLAENNKQTIAKAEQLIDQINELIKDGNTFKSQKLKADYQHLINNSSLSEKEKQQQHNLFKETNQMINKLSSWKNWASERERENLCAQAQDILQKIQTQLSDSPAKTEVIYQTFSGQIKLLRQEWKQLKGRANGKSWESFNDCCNQSFDLFAPYLEKQNQQRHENTEKKEKICQQLEDYIKHMQWPSIPDKQSSNKEATDWKQVDSILKQAKKEWHLISNSEKDSYKSLYSRYKIATKTIEKELNLAWADNATKFKSLIEQTVQLQSLINDNLPQAINECKKLQQQWKLIGPTQQRQRKELWKNFRKACDVIFAKRDELNDEKKQEDESLNLERTALCENLEALSKQQISRHDLQQAYKDIIHLWQNIPSIKNKKEALNLRFVAAKKAFNEKIDTLEQEEILHQFELLEERASFCSRIEKLTSDVDTDEEQQSWDSLEALTNKSLSEAMNKRFHASFSIQQDNTIDGTNKEIISNIQTTKEQLCLTMEIITGQESPEDKAQERMALQVENLNAKLAHSNQEQSDVSLVQQWYQLADIEEHSLLNARFFKAYQHNK